MTESGGKAIVIEYLKGELTIFDAPLGTITNALSYDWHETNLHNYINLSPVALPDKKIGDLDFKPLGGGSGMIGLPGDFTPPSRFVRAVALFQSARPTEDRRGRHVRGLPHPGQLQRPARGRRGLGDRNDPGDRRDPGGGQPATTRRIGSSITTRTHNRRVRKVDLAKIDFAKGTELVHQPLDKEKKQDIENVTPPGR